MTYQVKFHSRFIPEWSALDIGLNERVGEILDHLQDDDPFVGRAEVDTLNGSAHSNMKEIRVRQGREISRFAFAFDPTQRAVVLCGGDKQGMSEQLFINS